MRRTSVALSPRGCGILCYAPTNLLISAILYTDRGLKWRIPAMPLLGGSYLFAIAICVMIIDRGGSGRPYLLVLLFSAGDDAQPSSGKGPWVY